MHPYGSEGAVWKDALGELRHRHRRVLAIDLLGHGRSEAPYEPLTFRRVEGAFREALTAVLDEPAVLVGSGMGGWLAVRFALANPLWVRGLVLQAPAGAPLVDGVEDVLVDAIDISNPLDAMRWAKRAQRLRPATAFTLALMMPQHFSTRHLATLRDDLAKRAEQLTPVDLAQLEPPVLLLWPPDTHGSSSQLDFWRYHLPATAKVERPEGVDHGPVLLGGRRLGRRVSSFTAQIESERER